ncbi:MAG: protein kinase, partial [Candidatus Omnitrophica bacterium]|nr:protein kinase [Candidatus Omnitrophota bacterium]
CDKKKEGIEMSEELLVNRYRIIKKLGEGGMGRVWQVFDTLENREVALKEFLRKKEEEEVSTTLVEKREKGEATLDMGMGTIVLDKRIEESKKKFLWEKTIVRGLNKTLAKQDIGKTITRTRDIDKTMVKDTTKTLVGVQTTSRVAIDETETSEDEEMLRFKQEFRTMVKLKHPNTVEVYDYGVLENGNRYITMEIVPGQELRDILNERKLNLDEIYRILIQFTQVLNFIHSRLLVHRDIKPENVRVLPDGNIKVMDFGLMEQMGLPSTGEIAGTPLYLPPEAVTGGVIDARSDLYSLGCMAYELATGKPPFSADSIMELLRKHVNEKPLPVRELNPNIPQELERVIMKLLDKDPEYRYQSTAELINELIKISGYKEVIETVEQKKSYLNCAELIGREKEMQFLKDAFEEVRKGKGKSIFIGAPAGTGKSRLVQEFQLYVQLNEVPFVQGKCYEQGLQSYQPLAEAFRPLLPLTKKKVLDKYGAVLAKIIPELKNKGYNPPPPLDEMGEKIRLFENVTGWLKEVSKATPLVLYIEDIHWIDFASLEVLNTCIRELKDYPIMFLTSFRDDEVEEKSSVLHTVEEGETYLLKLNPLRLEHVNILIQKMLGRADMGEDFVGEVFKTTGGNPFFVSETIRVLIEDEKLKLDRGRWVLVGDISVLELPTSISVTITRRLRLLRGETLEIAKLASVVGRSLDLSFIKELSGLEDNKLFDILEELIERQFFQVEDKNYVFTHDRVRETLYSQLDEETKQRLHEKVGIIIEKRFAQDKESVINELAYHFSHSLNKKKAIDYLVGAGYSSRRMGNLFISVKFHKEALELLKSVDYPNKNTVIFYLRNDLIQPSYIVDPNFCTDLCKIQFEELNKLCNIKRLAKIFRLVFKILEL